MSDEIARMRAELNQYISPFFGIGPGGARINESFGLMRESDLRLNGRLPSRCQIPRRDGNGGAVVDCGRSTANCHAIQDKVLKRIASGKPPKVLDFMDIHTPRIARDSQGPTGKLWNKPPWNIERMPPHLVLPGSASARHFACNSCDKRTFLDIEDKPIGWPDWPETLIVDDLQPDESQLTLSRQMYLLAYRCLLQFVSQVQGLIAANDYAGTNDHRISAGYREIIKTRQSTSQAMLEKLRGLKSRYDGRLAGIATLPMTHYIVAVNPGFPLASTAFTDAHLWPMAITVYPELKKRGAKPTEWQHWLVVSAESAHRDELESSIKAKVEAAYGTCRDVQSSVEWTVDYVTDTGSLSTYGRPKSYKLFCQSHPDAERRIERHTPDMIVAEYHERYLRRG